MIRYDCVEVQGAQLFTELPDAGAGKAGGWAKAACTLLVFIIVDNLW
jgi:hypothetical protein